MYQDYKASRTSWGINALGTVVAEVELNNGMVGVGVSIGGEPACYIIEHHLSRFVEGQVYINRIPRLVSSSLSLLTPHSSLLTPHSSLSRFVSFHFISLTPVHRRTVETSN
jgi:hypothetical protein